MLQAEIITIGNEIVSGKTVDTNSAQIAILLQEIGIEIVRKSSVRDDINEIVLELTNNRNSSQIRILTGGLGPTNDDITVQALCRYFNVQLVLNHQVLEHLNQFFQKRNTKLTETNKTQAFVPQNATVFLNEVGTAPGLLFDTQEQIVIALPGIPFEMLWLMKNRVIPFLTQKFVFDKIITSRDYTFAGIGESFLYDALKNKTSLFQQQAEIAFLPSPGIVKVRLKTKHQKGVEVESVFLHLDEEFQFCLPENYIGMNVENLALHIQNLCVLKNITLSTAESCTGGYLSHLITSNPGSSAYFSGSVVSYANSIKTNILHVKNEDITQYGAVSRDIVAAMAKGVRNLMKTDFSIAISGIAGPEGGTMEKPVGTVWIAVDSEKQLVAEQFSFGITDRKVIIQRAANQGLLMLFNELKKFKR